MSWSDQSEIRRAINGFGIPLLVGAMILSTGVAVVSGCYFLYSRLGPDRLAQVVHDAFWVICWTGLSEGLLLLIGILVYWRLARRIETLQRELSDLTRGVLHDLKTPVTHIRNAAEGALVGNGRAEDALPTIIESCDVLVDVIDSNAEISRVQNASLPQQEPSVDFAAIVRACADLYADVAAEKGVAFSSDVSETPIPLHIPKAHLQHLAANLIDNAIKFTPTDGAVHVVLHADPGGLVELEVSDTGIGIHKAKQGRIFERFYRVDDSRHTPGHGLGLALVHAIITRWRGRIRLESAEGRGSTFRVELPVPRN